MKVLIIDDEEDFRTVASSCLGLLGGDTVAEACSGKEGIEMARSDVPDVILLDLCMDDMDGTKTLASLDCSASEIGPSINQLASFLVMYVAHAG